MTFLLLLFLPLPFIDERVVCCVVIFYSEKCFISIYLFLFFVFLSILMQDTDTPP